MQKETAAIGIIGAAGFIGRDHLRRLSGAVDGAEVTALYDLNMEEVKCLASQCGAKVMPSAESLIESDEVDAVVIASWDATHAALTRKCLSVGKPVFCEKPLATTRLECEDILADELSAGKPMVQVGFMRRFDPDYIKIKEVLDSRALGAPLMAHCVSRTPRIAASHTTPMHITNIVIHEIDVFRWLLGEELVAGRVLFPRSTSFAGPGLMDPQMVILKSESGVLIDIEAAANSYYGYEIQCEIVCEKGTIRLPEPASLVVRSRLQCSHEILDDWSQRFPSAYLAELQHWVDFIRGCTVLPGPGSWDGFMACAVSDMLISAQQTGQMEKTNLTEIPPLYKKHP